MPVLEYSTVGELQKALANCSSMDPILFQQDTSLLLDGEPFSLLVPIDAVHQVIRDGYCQYVVIESLNSKGELL